MKPHQAMDIGESYPTCLWHTGSDSTAKEKLKAYVEQATESSPWFQRLEADLIECRDCMGVYHEARERLIQGELTYDQKLFELEGRRLTATLSRDSDEQHIVVPVTEVLWHPFLLFNPTLEAAFCRRLLELDETIGLEGFLTECIPTMYLLLIHPNHKVRNLAWQCLQQPEYRITSDNYEDISQVLRWIISAQINGPARASARGQMPEVIRSPSQVKKLPAHLVCAASHTAYWQGVAHLLEIFSVEALKYGFMMSEDLKRLIQTVIDNISDHNNEPAEDTLSPFWPQLQCLTFLMDKLGSTMWQYVSHSKIETIFGIIKERPVFMVAICDLSSSNIQQLPSSFETSVSPSEPFLWMVPYINSLLDFGKSAAQNITAVVSFLCQNLTDLYAITTNPNLAMDLLVAKFMCILVKVLQDLLKTSLLSHLIREIQTSVWFKLLLSFLQRYSPVRAQQGISVVIQVANNSRQFLIDVFKLAQRNKLNVGRSTRYIKMLGLPLQQSAGVASTSAPGTSQMKLWEMNTKGEEFLSCASFVEETLRGCTSATSACGLKSPRKRRDVAKASASIKERSSSPLKHTPHQSKPTGKLSATPKTTKDANARQRNGFTSLGGSTNPKHAYKLHESMQPSATTSKSASMSTTSLPTKTVKKQQASFRPTSSSASPAVDQPGSTSKLNRTCQSSSDEVLLISDGTTDELSSRLPSDRQESGDNQPSEQFYSSSQSESSQSETDTDEVQHAQGVKWQPTVVLDVVPELQDIAEGQFIITSEDPLRVRQADQSLVKKEQNSQSSEISFSDTSIFWNDPKSSRRKLKKTKGPRRLRESLSSSDETSSGDDHGLSSSSQSSPVYIQSKIWLGSPTDASSSSSQWGTPRKYPRDRLSRTRTLKRSKKIPKYSSDDSESEPNSARTRGHVLGKKKEQLSDDEAPSSDEASQKSLLPVDIKVERNPESLEGRAAGSHLSNDNVLDAPISEEFHSHQAVKQEGQGMSDDEEPSSDEPSQSLLLPMDIKEEKSPETKMIQDNRVLDSPISVSDDSDSSLPEFVISVKQEGSGKGRKQTLSSADENTKNSKRQLFPESQAMDYLKDAVSPISDDPSPEKNTRSSNRRLLSDDQAMDYLKDAVSLISDDPSPEKNTRSSNRRLLSDDQAMDYLEDALSPVSDDSDSSNSCRSTSLLTQKDSRKKYDTCAPPKLKHAIGNDLHGNDSSHSDSSISDVAQQDSRKKQCVSPPQIISDENTQMAPDSPENNIRVPSDELQDIKPTIHIVKFQRTSASLSQPHSSQSFSDGFSIIEDCQDSEEVIDLDNYNCSELYDEDPLSQLIEISSDEDDDVDVDPDRSETPLEINLEPPIKKEPGDDPDPPHEGTTEHPPIWSEDSEYRHFCAMQDHEEPPWFDEEDSHQDQEMEEAVIEGRPSSAEKMELLEEGPTTEETSNQPSRSTSPFEDAEVLSALHEQDDAVWFDDSPPKQDTVVQEAGEGSLQEKEKISNHETTFEEAMKDIDQIAAAAERNLEATSQQRKRKKTDEEAHSRTKLQKKSYRRHLSSPGTLQSWGSKASTSAQSDAHAPVVAKSVSEPASLLPKVRGSWKSSNFHQPDFTPADAEPLRRSRGSNKGPELADVYALDSSQPQRRPRATNLEEERHTAPVNRASRFSSRTESLFQTMKEGPPPAQKGNPGKATLPQRTRHSSGPLPSRKSNKSLDSGVSLPRHIPSYLESLPYYAQPVYQHGTVPTSVPQIACQQSSDTSGAAADPSTLSSSGADGGNRNDDANTPGQHTDAEPGSPVVDNGLLVSKPQFQFFSSDPQMMQTAANLPSLVNSGLVRNSSAAATTEQGEASTSSKTAGGKQPEAPAADFRSPHQRTVPQSENSKMKPPTRDLAVSLEPKAAVPLPQTALFSVEDLYCWVIGWNSQWLNIYGPDAEGQPAASAPQAILADCPYKTLLDVPLHFDSVVNYYRVFIPLLLHEIWAQIQNKSDVKEPSHTAAFVECRQKEVKPAGALLNCSFKVPVTAAVCPIRPKDVVTVSPVDMTECRWSPMLAVVTSVNPIVSRVTGGQRLAHSNAQGNGANGGEKLFEVSLLVLAKNDETHQALSSSKGHDVQLQVLHSLTSSVRQFQGLISLHKCGLIASDILRFRRKDIFCQTSTPPSTASDSRQVQQQLAQQQEKPLNPCQLHAIRVASDAVATPDTLSKICLVSGPPGSGKTKTVIGLVMKILESHKENQHQRLPHPRGAKPTAKPPPILLCASSNASLNVLLGQLKAKTSSREATQPSVVRICGRSTLVHDSVKKYSLDNQVQARRNHEADKIKFDMDQRTKKQEKLQRDITELGTKCGRHTLDGNLVELYKAKEERNRLIKDLGRTNARLGDLKRQKAEVENHPNAHYERVILDDADIICCAVNLSGHELLRGTGAKEGTSRKMKFSCVIVDDAHQCTELDSIIPLQTCSMKVVLVGDSQLMPAQVTSKKAHQHGLHRSLFERLCSWFQSGQANLPPILPLEKQYRMHKEIAAFPSTHFYDGVLQSDKNMVKRRSFFFLLPYLVFNVEKSQEYQLPSRSFTNEAEGKMVLALYRKICQEKMNNKIMCPQQLRIGIITPYEDQKNYLSLCQEKAAKELSMSSPPDFILPQVTMDGFQGREMDVVIVTCVRSQASAYSRESSWGVTSNFLSDHKKMNFVLTRARFCLFIVANLSSLQNSPNWGALAADAERRRRVVRVSGDDFKRAATCVINRKAQSDRGAAQKPPAQAQPNFGIPKRTVEGALVRRSSNTGSGSAGTSSTDVQSSSSRQASLNGNKRTEVPQVPGSSLAMKSHHSVKTKKTTSSSKRKKVSFQENLDKGSSLLLPKPMQQNPGIHWQGKQQNPYKMASRASPRRQMIRRSPKRTPYMQILKNQLFRGQGQKSPGRTRENKLTGSRDQVLSSMSASPARIKEASHGRPSTSLNAKPGPGLEPLSILHTEPGHGRLAPTPSKDLLLVKTAQIGDPQPAGTSSSDLLQTTVENFKRRQVKEKKTMPLPGLQPDPKFSRRCWKSGATASAVSAPRATAPDPETRNSNGSNGPTRIPFFPSSDSE